jgi:hypothetical protein
MFDAVFLLRQRNHPARNYKSVGQRWFSPKVTGLRAFSPMETQLNNIIFKRFPPKEILFAQHKYFCRNNVLAPESPFITNEMCPQE